MDEEVISLIDARVSVQGVLTLQELNQLESVGVNLHRYLSRNEVSQGKVSYEDFVAAMQKHEHEKV